MKKLITIATLVAATLPAMTVSQPAAARDGAVAAGVVGGLAAGAIIGSAAARRDYYYGPAYVEPSYTPVYTNCRTIREREVTPSGRVIVRKTRICD